VFNDQDHYADIKFLNLQRVSVVINFCTSHNLLTFSDIIWRGNILRTYLGYLVVSFLA